MSDIIELEAFVEEDGRAVVNLPPDVPRGPVVMRLEVRPRETDRDKMADAGDGDVDFSDDYFLGEGKTIGEILESPEIGVGAFDHITDSAAYVEELRKRIGWRYQW